MDDNTAEIPQPPIAETEAIPTQKVENPVTSSLSDPGQVEQANDIPASQPEFRLGEYPKGWWEKAESLFGHDQLKDGFLARKVQDVLDDAKEQNIDSGEIEDRLMDLKYGLGRS